MTFRHESGESLGNLRIAPSLGIAPSLEDAVVAICMPLSDKERFGGGSNGHRTVGRVQDQVRSKNPGRIWTGGRMILPFYALSVNVGLEGEKNFSILPPDWILLRFAAVGRILNKHSIFMLAIRINEQYYDGLY